MGAGAVAEPRRASKTKAVTTVQVAANIFRWFVRLGAAAKQHHAYSPAEASAESPQAENTDANPTTAESFSAAHTTGVSADKDSGVSPSIPDKQEIERRRDLVRTFFNDFWRDAHDKPAAFVERLDQAGDYVNDRLAANGEAWRLDSQTRTMLGLPLRANSVGAP
jgi:hypothetical protein